MYEERWDQYVKEAAANAVVGPVTISGVTS